MGCSGAGSRCHLYSLEFDHPHPGVASRPKPRAVLMLAQRRIKQAVAGLTQSVLAQVSKFCRPPANGFLHAFHAHTGDLRRQACGLAGYVDAGAEVDHATFRAWLVCFVVNVPVEERSPILPILDVQTSGADWQIGRSAQVPFSARALYLVHPQLVAGLAVETLKQSV